MHFRDGPLNICRGWANTKKNSSKALSLKKIHAKQKGKQTLPSDGRKKVSQNPELKKKIL